ncbi:hypothetical protein FSARC_12724 [Fusarium sarcochroum]|uniref:WW domain-containing protein n=1 Tax=Fusarium sarcochroum TaxID=1208366 RepID=A0A8H4T6F6_9HYPO|nr:hypothetical protein FSARC_12724 [Fusarium sarcochroum]
MTTYDLGPLVGDTWCQHANSAGQIFYRSTRTQESQFRIPSGFEDDAQDTWVCSTTGHWPQWRNQRTGRIVLSDPNPPPLQSYLDATNVKVHLKTIERNPSAGESIHRRVMRAILSWLFPESEGYEVVQEEDRGNRPDFVVFKISCRPGGSSYSYDFCIVESKAAGAPWGSTEDQCASACFTTENDVKRVYAMVHIGTQMGFYTYEDGNFSGLSGKLHLRDDADTIMEWAQYIKDRPYPFVEV